jgi:hypothetical protein
MPGLKHHIIGLAGYAGSGKDTVAELLIAHEQFRKLAFADPLRTELADAFHVESLTFSHRPWKSQPMESLALTRCTDPGYVGAVLRHLAEGGKPVAINEELTRPRTPRETMQLWGTQYRRTQDDSYWTRLLVARISYYMRDLHEHRFAVTDCRFANEVEAVRSMGGQLWQVKRPELAQPSAEEGVHSSVNDGSAFEPDVVINNSHDMRHLQQLVLGEFWALNAGLDNVKVEITA